ncbi:MAG: DNA (cytosine-5-)-methyltransferase [Planctomycetes bacterium]|nr:DNA (cytosine-5-)-methyltransferase [Planctomycetota bacterium]
MGALSTSTSMIAPARNLGRTRTPDDIARLLDLAGLHTPPLVVRGLRVSPRTAAGYLCGRVPGVPQLRRLVDLVRGKAPGSADFRFIDLFAGIGGMRLGFEAAGGSCVFTCEWDDRAQQTYRANFGDEPIAGDIRALDLEAIPAHDVLVAGFPCQPFSIAGVSKKNALGRPHGFACEAQGTLFFQVARILKRHRPIAFLLENVKHLERHDQGRTFQVIRDVLERELGYQVTYRVVDAQGYVPQHRERIFLVGFREKCDFDLNNVSFPDPATGPRLKSILHPEDGTEVMEPPYTESPLAKVSARYTLTDHLWKYLRDYKEKHREKGNGFGFSLVGAEDVARTLSARYYKDGSEILVSRGKGARPRRLTPRECARLMGFRRAAGKDWIIPVSDTQAYKQFGNAVVVPVVADIAKAMRPFVREAVMLGYAPVRAVLQALA